MNRRSYLIAAGASATTLLTGCMGSEGTETTDESEQETTSTDPQGGVSTTEEPEGADETAVDEQSALSVVDEYVAAAAEGDVDALERTMHSVHPFNPANLSEEEFEEAGFGNSSAENYERALADTEFGTEDVVAELSESPVFEDENVSELVEGERATLVEISSEADGSGAETTQQLMMLTEGGEWRVLWPYSQQATLPGGAADKTYDIVDSVEYDTESERLRVNMSGVGEITAEELTVYTESAGEGNRTWAPDSDTLPDVSYLTAPFDPSGDEVVVTITVDGEETVVYREEYSPE